MAPQKHGCFWVKTNYNLFQHPFFRGRLSPKYVRKQVRSGTFGRVYVSKHYKDHQILTPRTHQCVLSAPSTHSPLIYYLSAWQYACVYACVFVWVALRPAAVSPTVSDSQDTNGFHTDWLLYLHTQAHKPGTFAHEDDGKLQKSIILSPFPSERSKVKCRRVFCMVNTTAEGHWLCLAAFFLSSFHFTQMLHKKDKWKARIYLEKLLFWHCPFRWLSVNTHFQ